MVLRGLTSAFAAILCLAGTSSPAQPVVQGPQAAIPCGVPYVAQRGDTLGNISVRAYGRGFFAQTYETNIDIVGPNPDLLEVDTVLRIPCLDDFVTNTGDVIAEQPESVGTPVEIVFHRPTAPDFFLNTGIMDAWLADISAATQGRVSFVGTSDADGEGGGLDPAKLARGEVGATYVANGVLADGHPLLALPQQPLIGGNATQTARALWQLKTELADDMVVLPGTRLLGFVAAPPAHVWPGVTLDGPADDWWTVYVMSGLDEKLGTSDTGFDQVAMSFSGARETGLWTRQKLAWLVDGGLVVPTFSVLISEQTWASLSNADREAIERLSGDALAQRSAAWDAYDNQRRTEMTTDALAVEPIPATESAVLTQKARESWQAWMGRADNAGLPGFSALTRFTELINTFAAP